MADEMLPEVRALSEFSVRSIARRYSADIASAIGAAGDYRNFDLYDGRPAILGFINSSPDFVLAVVANGVAKPIDEARSYSPDDRSRIFWETFTLTIDALGRNEVYRLGIAEIAPRVAGSLWLIKSESGA